MKVFLFDAARCNGCHNCQVACKDEHCGNDWMPYAAPQPDTGHFWMQVQEIEHGQAPKVRLEYRACMCNHCDDAACIKAAPDCVYRRDDGLVIIDPEKAKGRRDIVESCPHGRIFWNDELALPQKCTGCAHLIDAGQVPHCVDLCATGALRFGDESDFSDEISSGKAVAVDAGGGRVYCMNMPKLFVAGEVWDPFDDEIIEGACVHLVGEGVDRSELTDGFGDFWFKGLEPGNYQLEVSVSNYLGQSKQFRLDKSLNLGDFPLRRA
ncbi:4Fe-4S dicluster domain-containing protein [Adlercreutzia sp. ZJ304]|uniref:4Fe-4S dicluster domain-containing protein n=1 Tax=Adlercreutzia sp. ZJ304 TaxID=2709791 RepID=UPI0013EB91A3|nr:4Fe-4S dicluster domain-containing protein [Adlercreutzia sp. ZJ304]